LKLISFFFLNVVTLFHFEKRLPPWDKKWPEDDLVTIVAERVRTDLQDFVRESLESKTCKIPPLVVHVDDYIGPQQPALLGELSYVSSMTQIAKVRKQRILFIIIIIIIRW